MIIFLSYYFIRSILMRELEGLNEYGFSIHYLNTSRGIFSNVKK